MLFRKIYNLADKLEDKVRGKLSHYPLIYAFIGGSGIIIFWRGIWHTVDYIVEVILLLQEGVSDVGLVRLAWWDGPVSILVGTVLLLTVGLFVSSFIGNEIVISGLKKEKKVVEKTEEEVEGEIKEDKKIRSEIHEMDERLKRIENLLKK